MNPHFGFLPSDVEGMDDLVGLALDLRWSWNHEADEVWQALDPDLWAMTHNAWIVLLTMSHEQLRIRMADPAFRGKINDLLEKRQQAADEPAWFQKKYSGSALKTVAYFSMEYMLSEALPIYVGGLGNVAGDQLKAAADLGVPVTAVGLLYQQGYFRQEIDRNGNQLALFPYNDPMQLPITPLRLPNGEWLRIKVTISGYPVWLRTWQVQVGRTRLYLLDSNDAANLPIYRGLTSEVYGGGEELRIKQEIILGIGGWRLLRALGIRPEVCHMNEGHAAFLVLERAGDFMKETGVSFEEALAVTRAGNLFTTHTAVAAGFDHFNPSLVGQYLGSYAWEELHLSFDALMALGRENPNDHGESFNMAWLAVRGSGAVNGVSQLHGKVSQQLFQSLFPRWPRVEVPVGSVTNGVHMPSWDSSFSEEVWTHACGQDAWKGGLEGMEQSISCVPDEFLWEMRNRSKDTLVRYMRDRLARQWSVAGYPADIVEAARHIFDPAVLTLSFARRFVPYKRPFLLLHDEQRLIRILTNPDRPVQLILAGKTSPADESGKALIRQWIQFIERYRLYRHVVFISDYDMLLTENLVRGVDVWLNTPRRPWEASGTSGMKVLVNGGINVSELDGWWVEAYTPEVGWALGDGKEHGDDPAWDAEEANALYNILEQQLIPEFYTRNERGIPEKWVHRMRKSMSTLTPQFSANRTVREYTEKYYLPAAAKYLQRAEEKGAAGSRIVASHRELAAKWDGIHFGAEQSIHADGGYVFGIPVGLNGIDPAKVVVELYADSKDGGEPEKIVMQRQEAPPADGLPVYSAKVQTSRPASDYTIRVIPAYEDISSPLEDTLIRWQR
ncbi:alpha-glucan phosphorylase [Puia dinghuensis]|uniref:Alpha-glucan phosphorylase n=2 Tax=Puia dinghuensis TaxID=1792502 RepID=A0A8J2UEG8_9BACT|nr:alpha-glucan phosphorylase [Puia dinghuensis]